MNEKKIKVLIVDDSYYARELLVKMIEDVPNFEVVGQAEDGVQAVEMTLQLHPDVIIMDIIMPNMNGFEATRQIMTQAPTRIIIVSGVFNKNEMLQALEALDAGALTVIEKPRWVDDEQYQDNSRYFTEAIQALAGIKVESGIMDHLTHYIESPIINEGIHIDVIAIGASLGGPPVLSYLLSKLPANYPIPILIHQHIIPNFIDIFAEWLNAATPLTVKVAKAGETISPGHVYLAGENTSMEINNEGVIHLKRIPSKNGFPIDDFFQSIASSYGPKGMGLLLKGIGTDGLEGIKALQKQDALTLVQDICVHQVPLLNSKDAGSLNPSYVSFDKIVKVFKQLGSIKAR